QVRAPGRPEQCGAPEGPHRRVLAELSLGGRRRHAVLRRGALSGGALARGQLPAHPGPEMSPDATGDSAGKGTGLLWLLALLGAAAFLFGVFRADPKSTWGIYLVNLIFWSCLAIVGPTLAGAIQVTEGRWSPSVKRIALLILFVLVVSLWAFDLVMTLDPIWYSGLFGGYYVVKALYTGFGLVTFLTIRANARGVTNVAPSGIQDMAKLTFAMSVMWMYFFFSQYLVIWYGNVPIETRFFVARFFNPPWGVVAWLVF